MFCDACKKNVRCEWDQTLIDYRCAWKTIPWIVCVDTIRKNRTNTCSCPRALTSQTLWYNCPVSLGCLLKTQLTWRFWWWKGVVLFTRISIIRICQKKAVVLEHWTVLSAQNSRTRESLPALQRMEYGYPKFKFHRCPRRRWRTFLISDVSNVSNFHFVSHSSTESQACKRAMPHLEMVFQLQNCTMLETPDLYINYASLAWGLWKHMAHVEKQIKLS